MENAPQSHRDLPPLFLVVAATAIVVLAPSAVGWGLRTAGTLAALPAIVVAAVLSLALSFLGQLYWQRRRASSEALFAELMIWGWARRRLIERRVNEAIDVLELTHDRPARGPIDLSMERRAALFRQLAADLEESDPYTHGHSQRVARYAALIGAELGLTRPEVEQLRTAALLHDVGKLYTPKEILHKPGRLTDSEFEVIKRHPVDGARMIRLLLADDELTSIVLHHHERFDGGGYPSGLTGNLIPFSARIIAVADTFDAITSKRPYRLAMPHKVALGILRREAGTQLDPNVVRAFLAAYSGREPRAAAAGIAAAVEAFIPSVAGAGVRLAGVAAGAAVLATGGLTLPWGAHLRPASPTASPTAHRFEVVAERLVRRSPIAATDLPARGVSSHRVTAHAGSGPLSGVRRATVPKSVPTAAPTAARSPSPASTSTDRSPIDSKPANPAPSTHGISGGGVTGVGGGSHGAGGAVGGGGVGLGGGGPVTVTLSGSGVGATVTSAGTSVGVSASANPSSPGATVSVGGTGGGRGTTLTVPGGLAGIGTGVSGSVTTPRLP